MNIDSKLSEFFKNSDPRGLRSLSDQIMVEGFVKKDKKEIRLAVIAHSLSIIVQKDYYKKDKAYWDNFVSTLKTQLNDSENFLDEIEKEIVELDGHFGRYKENVLHLSRIRKGSTLYAWGVSLTLASSLVDVPEYELMKQIGRTKIVDEEGSQTSVESRLKVAEESL
ncbi:MAG: hypothetical protein GOU98_03495 [Candidatus Altiarchaeota archaeon]|nr:hypothetical protein [Candidatus Altiarchaeota archaeon]